MLFNPSNDSFRKATRGEIYIDKTGLIAILNKLLDTERNCVALSHARRFGKSQAAGMIDAYYSKGSNSKELFAPFAIARDPDFEKYLNKYNVIHLDIASLSDLYASKDNGETVIDYTLRCLYDELKKSFPDADYTKKISSVLSEICEASGCKFVIIVDEWDCVIRNLPENTEIVHKYLQFLHDMFKSEQSKSFLALAYITGILPVKKIMDESALNNFFEYTMIHSYEMTQYFGFTEEEVISLCGKFDMDYPSVKKWYNGYLIDGRHMYNPNSVYDAMTKHSLESFWRNTSSFGTINNFITLNYEGLKDAVMNMLEGGMEIVDTSAFQNDLSSIESKDDALTALIHLGYLGYDAERKKAYIPNFEVAEAYRADIAGAISRCDELLDNTIEQKAMDVAQIIDRAHEVYASVIKYNDENSLSCVITMAYFTASAYYDIYRELPAGKGFADMVFVPRRNAGNRPALIVELKYDRGADTAIKQIKDRRYAGALSGYKEKILLVGISYDRETKAHECIIEEFHDAL